MRKKLENKAIDKSTATATPEEKYALAIQLWAGAIGIQQNKKKAIELYRDAAGHPAQQVAQSAGVGKVVVAERERANQHPDRAVVVSLLRTCGKETATTGNS